MPRCKLTILAATELAALHCVHTAGPKGRTPLHLAAQFGHTAVLEVLLDSGLHPDTCSPSAAGEDATALFCATDPAVAQLLIDRGANVLHVSGGGGTCLHTCVCRPNPIPILKVLLAAGADPTVQQTALDKEIAAQVAERGLELTPAAIAGFQGEHVARALLLEAEARWTAAKQDSAVSGLSEQLDAMSTK
jgi:ankyrin repeat protein